MERWLVVIGASGCRSSSDEFPHTDSRSAYLETKCEWLKWLKWVNELYCFLSTALASNGTIPITSLDGSNLLFANTSGSNGSNMVTFLNPQNLSLLNNPVSLLSTGGLQVDAHHQSTAVPVQTSTISTASKAQWIPTFNVMHYSYLTPT